MRTNILIGTSLLLTGLIASCSGPKKERQTIEQEIAKWSGRQLQLPAEPVFLRYALDTVSLAMEEREYKILVYTDSSGCTSCKLQLPKWKEMLALTDSLLPGKVTYLFFFDNPRVGEIRHLLKQADLSYPVCINRGHDLNRLNNFPPNPQFQTFLLDKQNRVMAVGNPALSPAVRELYIRRMTGKEEKTPVRRLTLAEAEPAVIDFGLLEGKETRTNRVKLTNRGKEPLVLLEATADCGCTETVFSREPLPPGKSTWVEVRFTPADKGTFSKTIRLYANVSEPILLTLRGEVVSL